MHNIAVPANCNQHILRKVRNRILHLFLRIHSVAAPVQFWHLQAGATNKNFQILTRAVIFPRQHETGRAVALDAVGAKRHQRIGLPTYPR